ncbi:MAG: VWA domain-containing protein [Vicinamibacterales bacterium]
MCTFLALALALSGLGQSAFVAAASAPPTVVSIPVVVLDSQNQPVATLGKTDFNVADRGKPVPVLDVTYVPVPSLPPAPPSPSPVGRDPGGEAGADAEAAAAREPGTRVFGLFLDEYHVTPAATDRVRERLADFVRTHTSDRDLFLVVKPLDPLAALPIRRGRAEALATIATFEGRLGVYEPKTTFERDLIAADPVRTDRARTRISFSAIQTMATRLGRLGPARKALIIVSNGVTSVRTVSRAEVTPTAEGIVRAADRGNVTISTWQPDVEAATAPRPAEPARDRPGPDETLLNELVRLTDGRRLGTQAAEGLAAVAADLGGYYLVTLDGADDGQFHSLRVQVSRPRLRVQARPGYWAIAADELARLSRAMAPPAARPVLAPLRASRLIVPWVGQEPGEGGRTRLTLVWDAAPSRAGERSRVLPPSRVVVTAQTVEGATVFEGIVQAGSSGLDGLAQASFEVQPGRVRLQLSIEDASARVLDTDVREVVVAPFGDRLAFGTPRVHRARTAREFHALEADPDAPPSAARTFARTERLLIRVPLKWDEAGAAVKVRAELLNRSGQPMRVLPVTRTPGMSIVTTDLSLAGLPSGEYRVQWRASRGTDEANETLSLRVTP